MTWVWVTTGAWPLRPAEFTPHEKALFMRFISGRERLPVRLKVMPLHTKDDPDNYLPPRALRWTPPLCSWSPCQPVVHTGPR